MLSAGTARQLAMVLDVVACLQGMAIDIALKGGHQAVATPIRQGVARVFPMPVSTLNGKSSMQVMELILEH